jgi:hypothetical protein
MHLSRSTVPTQHTNAQAATIGEYSETYMKPPSPISDIIVKKPPSGSPEGVREHGYPGSLTVEKWAKTSTHKDPGYNVLAHVGRETGIGGCTFSLNAYGASPHAATMPSMRTGMPAASIRAFASAMV